MLETQHSQINDWKEELWAYEKSKRTKKPHGKSLPKIHFVSDREVKLREAEFNPILQTYRDPRRDYQEFEKVQTARNKSLLKQVNKEKRYSLPYDIVNLHGSDAMPSQKSPDPNKKLGPVRNIYNVINNQVLPDTYLSGRDVRLNLQHPRHLVKQKLEDYDAVANRYRKAHEHKMREDEQSLQKSAWLAYNTRMETLDHLTGKYYSQNLEQTKRMREEAEKERERERMEKILPPSYRGRQSVVLDPQSSINQTFRTLDVRRQNEKKRFEKRYIIEDEYRRRNEEDDEHHNRVVKNHVHDLRIWEEKSKQFDIINAKNNYPHNRADQLFGRSPATSSWAKTTLEGTKIKSRGFA